MAFGLYKYLLYMIPVVWRGVKDLLWEELSLGEIRLHYLFGKANAFDRAGFLERAAQVYERILKGEENNLAAFLNLGGLYYRGGLYEKAVPCYEKAIQLNPKHYQAHYWLASCFWKLERYYAALNTLDEVIGFLPTFKDALNLMGECYERIGEAAKAEHFYLKAISTDPGGIVGRRPRADRPFARRRREERMKH
jgi:tetratricopeptide (TPR) repeat protein